MKTLSDQVPTIDDKSLVESPHHRQDNLVVLWSSLIFEGILENQRAALSATVPKEAISGLSKFYMELFTVLGALQVLQVDLLECYLALAFKIGSLAKR